jgi:ferredoxin
MEQKHWIDSNLCVVCDACRPVCPRNAVSAHESEPTYIIDSSLCNNCQNISAVRCVPQCPVDAIKATGA